MRQKKANNSQQEQVGGERERNKVNRGETQKKVRKHPRMTRVGERELQRDI